MPAHDAPFWNVPRAILATFLAFALIGAGIVVYPIVDRALAGWVGEDDGEVQDACAQQTGDTSIAVFCNPGDVQRAPSKPRGSLVETPRTPSAPRGTLLDP